MLGGYGVGGEGDIELMVRASMALMVRASMRLMVRARMGLTANGECVETAGSKLLAPEIPKPTCDEC